MNEQMRMNLDGARKRCAQLATAAVEAIQCFNDIEKELKEQEEREEHPEPLIKDEKTRKVFREWASFFGAERFRTDHFCNAKTTLIKSTELITEPSIELPGHIGEDSEIYTIAELCGEEEE